MRVPTLCPIQLHVYFNGRNLLANQPAKGKTGFSTVDNAFDYIEDFENAQKIPDNFAAGKLLKKLTLLWLAGIYCRVQAKNARDAFKSSPP